MRLLIFFLGILLTTGIIAQSAPAPWSSACSQPTPGCSSAATVPVATTYTLLIPLVRTPAAPPFFVYYYMWWSERHWQEKLGPSYPWDGTWPVPGALDPATQCGATTSFAGNTLVDLPIAGPYDQLTSTIMETHVRQAAATGLTGFLAGWQGTGKPNEQVNDTGYNKRLDRLVQTIGAYNAAAGAQFQFTIDYETFGEIRTVEQIANDIDYLLAHYGSNPSWGRLENRRVLRWSNTKDFPTATLQAVAEQYRDRLFIVGEERLTTWTPERAQYLDGTGHYWSTQDPYRNPKSFEQDQAFAARVHADGKHWFAPLAPGYNDELAELAQGVPVTLGDCVPRKGTETMRRLFEGNRRSDPDGWFVISWNEWLEHTYIEPSQRYGAIYLDELARIIAVSR